MSATPVPCRQSQPGRRRPHLLVLMALAVLIAAIGYGYGPPCLTRMILHVPCPGCGFSRALQCAFAGRFLLSLRYHPLCLPSLAVGGGYASAILLCPSHAQKLVSSHNLFGIAGVYIAVWLVRLCLFAIGFRFFLW